MSRHAAVLIAATLVGGGALADDVQDDSPVVRIVCIPAPKPAALPSLIYDRQPSQAFDRAWEAARVALATPKPAGLRPPRPDTYVPPLADIPSVSLPPSVFFLLAAVGVFFVLRRFRKV